MKRRRFLLAAGMIFCTVFVEGCGPRPPALTPVSGVVKMNGKPVPNALVQFVPSIQGFGGEFIAEGVTDQNGRFELSCTRGKGACVGENLVIVSEGPTPADVRGASAEAQMKATQYFASLTNRPIPEKFCTAAQSPLKVVVTIEQSIYDIDLTAGKVTASR
jgi:hypothetical protein